jgi:hypothetical protein
MILKGILSIATCMLFCSFTKAQGIKNPSITYQLPEKIDSLICSYLVNAKSSNESFFILCSVMNDTTSLLVCKRTKDFKINSLITRSNRFWKYKELKVPIILKEDLLYNSDFHETEKSKSGKTGVVKYAFTFSGQLIEFYVVNENPSIIHYTYFQY